MTSIPALPSLKAFSIVAKSDIFQIKQEGFTSVTFTYPSFLMVKAAIWSRGLKGPLVMRTNAGTIQAKLLVLSLLALFPILLRTA